MIKKDGGCGIHRFVIEGKNQHHIFRIIADEDREYMLVPKEAMEDGTLRVLSPSPQVAIYEGDK